MLIITLKAEVNMSYEAVLEKVKSVPEECLDEISLLIDSVVAQHEKESRNSEFIFDSLVHHTDRADNADDYIRSFRDNDKSRYNGRFDLIKQ